MHKFELITESLKRIKDYFLKFIIVIKTSVTSGKSTSKCDLKVKTILT